jgi:hypothetical protein
VKEGLATMDVSTNPLVVGKDLSLKKPYLKAPNPVKVGELKQFVKQKYLLNDKQFSHLEILINFQNKVRCLVEERRLLY